MRGPGSGPRTPADSCVEVRLAEPLESRPAHDCGRGKCGLSSGLRQFQASVVTDLGTETSPPPLYPPADVWVVRQFRYLRLSAEVPTRMGSNACTWALLQTKSAWCRSRS